MSQKFKSQIDAEQGIKITNELYDGSAEAGSSGQVLSSTGSATQWIDFNSDTAERIQVTVKNVYGIERIYPYCEQSEIFAILTNSRTLSDNAIKWIKTLGYTFEVVTTKKI